MRKGYGLLRLIGVEEAPADEEEAPRRTAMTREELERRVGAVEIVGVDGCIGYYVVTQICGRPVIWQGRRAYAADWDRYGQTWQAYKVDEEGTR